MSRFDLPIDDWGLLLTPRFGGLGSPAQEFVLGLLILVPLLLLFWLYRYEMHLVRRAAAVALLGLRMLLIVLLWAMVCWQPILARSEIEEVPSRVLIAADLSGSMDTSDPQRSSLEKLLLAKALKLQPDGQPPPRDLIEDWIKRYQKNEDDAPTLSPAQQKVHDQLCAEVDKLTRGQIAQLILAPTGMDLHWRLGKNHEVELVAFEEQLWELDRKQFISSASKGGKFTDLSLPLQRALETAGSGKGKMLGLILLTDGRDTAGGNPEAKLKEFKDRQIPIFPVALGGKKPPADIAIVKVNAPANLLPKTPSQLGVEIKVTGLPAQQLVVEMAAGGKEKPEQIIIEHNGENRTYIKEFPLQPDKLGTHAFTVKVKPADDKVKEITDKNNTQAAVVRVVEDKARVLLIDGEVRWEHHYLANALVRDEAMKMDQVVFLQPSIGALPKNLLKEAGHPLPALPKWEKGEDTSDPLQQYHCIVLGDVLPELLPSADRERLAKFVSERGGTLILLAGKNAMPLSYLAPPLAGQPADALAKMVPVEKLKVITPEDGFAFHLHSAGEQAPYLQLDEDPVKSKQVWAKLPLHHWGLVGKARPGATVLARAQESATAKPGKGDDRDDALMVVQNYGFGRVVYIGMDSTWRWRFRKGDAYHHRFWGQLILWAASDQLLPAGNKYVRYGTKQPVYKHAEDVEIFVRLEDLAPALSAKAKVQAKLIGKNAKGEDEAMAVVSLTPDGGGLSFFKGSAKNLPAGKYRIELDIPESGDKLKLPSEDKDGHDYRDSFVVQPPENKEQAQLAVDWSLLDSLAQKSGGGSKALTPAELEDLIGRLSAEVIAHEQSEERRPWQDEPLTWYLLAALLTLLTVEWTIRKLAALP